MIISKNTKFVIYGTGEVGKSFYNNCKNQGWSVTYAIDRDKCGSDILNGVITYRLGEEPYTERKEVIVVICLADGLEHRKVVENLVEQGYQYMVCLPLGLFISEEKKIKMIMQYDQIIAGCIEDKYREVSEIRQYLMPAFDTEQAVLIRNGHWLVVNCPLEILFTECVELCQGDKTKLVTNVKYKNKSIASSNPCKELFDFFAGQEEKCDLYFLSKDVQYSFEKKRDILMKRFSLYQTFLKEYNKGMHFFIVSATEAVWNSKNYWNLVGGHHRTSFLLHKGHKLFPIKVTKKDFEWWCNDKASEKLELYIREHNIKNMYAPIPHPAFLDFPARNENGEKTCLEAVLNFLSEFDISEYYIADTLLDEAYFARVFDRIGAAKAVYVNNNIQQQELSKLCCTLLYRNNVEIMSTLDEEYDIIFCNREERKKWQYICKKLMFQETWMETDQKMIFDENEQVIFKEFSNDRWHLMTVKNVKDE